MGKTDRLINFRCNIVLLEMFGALCRADGSDISKALRGFMVDCVGAGEIVKRNSGDVKTGDFRDSISNIHNIPSQW